MLDFYNVQEHTFSQDISWPSLETEESKLLHTQHEKRRLSERNVGVKLA